MKAKNVQTSECKELLLLFNSSSSFCLSSINVKMVLLAYLKELQRAHHQLQFIEDRLEILRKSHPITMEGLLSKFSRSKLVLHQLRWTTSGAILENQFGGGSHTNVFHLRSFVELTRLIFFTVFILSVYILYDQNRYTAFQIDLKCPLNVFKVTENSYKINIIWKQLVSTQSHTLKKIMAPFLWMGFNCPKITEPLNGQYTFYHSVP